MRKAGSWRVAKVLSLVASTLAEAEATNLPGAVSHHQGWLPPIDRANAGQKVDS